MYDETELYACSCARVRSKVTGWDVGGHGDEQQIGVASVEMVRVLMLFMTHAVLTDT
jgi:hypothetical protein